MANWLERTYWSAFVLWNLRGQGRFAFRPLAKIEALQGRRVRSMVRHAYATVPFYREAMDAAGLSPQDIRAAGDLALLPLVEGEQLAFEPERFRSTAFDPGRCLEVKTSGTSQRPKRILYDPAAVFIALAHRRRERAIFKRFVGRTGRLRRLALVKEVTSSTVTADYQRRHAWLPGLRWGRTAPLALPREGIEENVRLFNASKPDLLFGYGSIVGALFRWCHEKGVEPHRPKLVVYAAENLPEADRGLIEGRFGIPVVSSYSAVETMTIAYQCERRSGFHVALDDVAVRVIDGKGKPVGPGGTGEIVVSNLFNRATVLLNYKLGDVVTLGNDPCPCGRTLPTLKRIEGRSNDRMALPDGSFEHVWVIVDLLETVPGIVQLQFVQEAVLRFRVRAIWGGRIPHEEIRRGFERVVKEHFGATAELEVEFVETMPPGPSGKVRKVISHCTN